MKYLHVAHVIRVEHFINEVIAENYRDRMRRSNAAEAARQGLVLDGNELWEAVWIRQGADGRWVSAPHQTSLATHVRYTLEQAGEPL